MNVGEEEELHQEVTEAGGVGGKEGRIEETEVAPIDLVTEQETKIFIHFTQTTKMHNTKT